MQAMDNSHVALSSIELRREGFEPYRCDRPMSIGISLAALTKIVRSADNNDTLTMRKADDGDSLGLMFESTSEYSREEGPSGARTAAWRPWRDARIGSHEGAPEGQERDVEHVAAH
jgi:hypothetical protein